MKKLILKIITATFSYLISFLIVHSLLVLMFDLDFTELFVFGRFLFYCIIVISSTLIFIKLENILKVDSVKDS